LSKIFTRLYNKGNNIKRMLIILLMLSMAAGIFTACSSSKNTDNSGKFTVGFDAEFPPYGYKDDNGEYVGFDLDLAQAVCDKNGWTLVKQPIDWDSKDMELNSGTIDCIWNGFTMTGREKDYTWSSAYIDNSQVVIVKSDAQINNLSDLAGKVVAVQSDSSALAAFTGEDASESNIQLAKSFSSLQQVGDYNSAFMNLESGSVDAICMDIGVAGYELKARGNSFRMLSEHVSSEEYGIGFKKGNTKLRDQVQETLNEMLADGTFMDIAKKWNVDESVCLGQEGKDSVMKAEGASDGSGSQNGFTDILGQLSTGMISTLGIFVLTLIFSLPLGLLLTFIRMSKLKVLQWIAKIYISIMRGTPLMLQLLVVFFGPYYLFGVSLSYSYRFYAVIIGFSLNYAAYFAEIYRAGIEGVPKGQYEAADVLGYSKAQTFIKIIFPQMVKAVLPPVTNEVITLVKDTSLAFALAYTEMFTLAKQVAATQASIMPLFVAGLFYYIFNFIVAYIMERLEKKMQYYR
jgi:His/Glu/Gln/Arg/opine family amino acid ABC transporter permease subunit